MLTRCSSARGAAIALLVLVGLVPVCAALINPLWGFAGTLTGASPVPLVFDSLPGYEAWACRYEIALTYPDGTRQQFELSPDVLARMPRPHWPHLVHAVYALPFALSPVMDRALWEPPLRAALCRDGPFLRALGARGPARTLVIQITTKAAEHVRSWRVPYRC